MFSKKSVIILLVVILILAVGGGFWYWQKTKKDISSTQNVVEIGKKENIKFNVFIKPAEKKYDTDHDGISNEDEKKMGLNESTFDTDGDGLSDYLEINTWKTDPKKSDTDGDGFSDGREVSEGYNPLGDGKLK